MHTFTGLDSLTAAQGQHLGYGGWHEITQEQVQQFADATGDHQWIHLDTERAAKGPFGGTVAHGYLTLSLLPMLGREIYDFRGFSMGVNYGLNKVRFPSAVRVGSRVRAGAELKSVTPVALGVQAVFAYTVEIEGEDKPGCVAEAVVLLVPGKDTT
ncbi:Acyl dehydratase [Actinokineospora alba]|uniref:Acyl dehydratase n=1 Tax=Actinokineospora alba TaxID=504798 RepID=A0A1H0UWX5_9PSEU|nr:MaoC family dehydratase [Actinokineospora alba]TDP69005.1 acyl dehydratase [Actinokineospora alba]SDI77393.1 Acyl dehydratase [Actinokineospora alba]SDP70677.1 Acyl dehydratase [Actinokineospora alba]